MSAGVPTSAVSESEFRPVAVIEFDLAGRLDDVHNLDRYTSARALVRLHGVPLGIVEVPVVDQKCSSDSLRRAACRQLTWQIVSHLASDALASGIRDAGGTIVDLPSVTHSSIDPSTLPTVSVVVCSRDRAPDLVRCLSALQRLDPAPAEILVVDNAPRTEETRELVASFRGVRYIREPRPGLDWARSRGVIEARSEIVAFTDDDVIVDRGWVGALARTFADVDVAAVTGLVLPFELETEAQALFERYGGFARGFERREYRVDTERGERASTLHGGTGKFGTGANMAFRRAVLSEVGLFDPALDVGTVTNGGGDLEMFHRILAAGRVLVYEPAALVWHRHRRTYAKLREQIANNGIGFYSYLVRGALRSRADRWPFIRLGLWWLWWWNVRRLLQTFYKPGQFPRDLIVAELVGSFKGLLRYQRAVRIARAIELTYRDDRSALPRIDGLPRPAIEPATSSSVREIDISEPVIGLDDVGALDETHIAVMRGTRLIGMFTIENRRRSITAVRLRQAIVATFGVKLFADACMDDGGGLWASAVRGIERAFGAPGTGPAALDSGMDVSIVVATRDRPDDLHCALASLTAQRTRRRVEIVVVDNHPESGLTPPVVAQFPGVRLVMERRGGLSYARNAGIAATSGAIVVSTDDDVIVPPHWIETLVAPFRDPEVMVVTGHVLPTDLSTPAQRLFEAYGGLGRGLDGYTVDKTWFWKFRGAVPTWALGGTANAAFRASIFAHPQIGLLDEALGAGTPTGCSEDTDLFYRVLRAGYRIAYEPQAFVWHRHRRDIDALRRQIYAYAKGHVAYQLTTLFRYGDWRAVARLTLELPRVYWWRLRARLRSRRAYPLSLILVEIRGTLAGPFAWWRSQRRVRRLGRSTPYSAVPRHATVEADVSMKSDSEQLIA
jgi:GT2 family glycosyltransferase